MQQQQLTSPTLNLAPPVMLTTDMIGCTISISTQMSVTIKRDESDATLAITAPPTSASAPTRAIDVSTAHARRKKKDDENDGEEARRTIPAPPATRASIVASAKSAPAKKKDKKSHASASASAASTPTTTAPTSASQPRLRLQFDRLFATTPCQFASMTLSPAGNLVCACAAHGFVAIVDSHSTAGKHLGYPRVLAFIPQRESPELEHPVDVAVDSKSREMFVADAGSNRVLVYCWDTTAGGTASATLVRKIGPDMCGPTSVVFVAKWGTTAAVVVAYRDAGLVRMTPDGRDITPVGTDVISRPRALAVDERARLLYVSDRDRIHVMCTRTGRHVRRISLPRGPLKTKVSAMAVHSETHDLVVADRKNYWLLVFNRDGVLVDTVKHRLLYLVNGLTFDQTGRWLYVAAGPLRSEHGALGTIVRFRAEAVTDDEDEDEDEDAVA